MPSWTRTEPVEAAFFDADGTLLSFATHQIPESTKQALHELKRAGVKCFLATGRPPYQVDMIDIEDMEAFILFNGQFVLNRYGVIFQQPIDPDDIRVVVDQVHQGLYNCAFMEATKCYVSGRDELLERAFEAANIDMPTEDIDQALDHDIIQLNIFLGPGKTDIVTKNTKHLKLTRWSPNFVDAFPLGGGKARAVARMLRHYEIPPEHAICFGDGGNDLEMFGVVGTSIAMGNGNPEVNEFADYVTDDVDHDGIWNACVRLGLIPGKLRGNGANQ